MRVLLPFQSVLALALAASVALAGEREKRAVRPLFLTESPTTETHRIHVRNQVVTTLRFETYVDPARTKMIGWEGRLEPLAVVRNKIILEPTHDLDDDEAIPLVVTLLDGTELPFLLRPPSRKDGGWTDQQVDIFKDQASSAATQAALSAALKKNDALTSENERYQREETSEDHALAALLVAGAVKQTPFVLSSSFSGKDMETDIRATVWSGKGKAAVVLKINNIHAEDTWGVQRVELYTLPDGKERAVAVRSSKREILPGQSGVLAVVVDERAFVDEGVLKDLSLEVYRQDGKRQAYVTLDHRLVAR